VAKKLKDSWTKILVAGLISYIPHLHAFSFSVPIEGNYFIV